MALAKTGNKYFKIILIACVIALTAYLFYSFKKVDFINNKIKQVVAEKTDQLYKVHYDSISVNEVEGNLFIKNLYIQGDTARQKQLINNGDTNAAKIILDIHIPVLEVRHFKTAAALLSKQLQANQVVISNAKVICYVFPNVKKPSDAKKQQEEVYKQILGNFKLIRVDSVSVATGEVTIKDFSTKEVKFHTYNTSIALKDVAIDSTYNVDTTRTLFCKQIEVNADKAVLGDKNNTAQISGASFDTRSQIVAFKEFRYDGFKSNNAFQGKLQGVSLGGLSLTGPVENSSLIIKKAVVEKGELEAVTRNAADKNKGTKPPKAILTGWINQFSLDSLQLKSLSCTIRNTQSADKPYTLSNNSFSIQNIKIDRSSKLDESLVNYAGEIIVSNDKISLISADNLYEYRLSGLKLNSAKKNIFIKEARIIPRFTEADFSRKAGTQIVRFDVNLRNINCEQVDIAGLVKGEFNVGNVITRNNSVKAFTDLSYPADTTSNRGPQLIFPHQMIHDISLKIRTKRFTATNSYVEYKENNPKTGSSGRVRFSNTSLTINNISNYENKQDKNTTASFTSTFLDKVPVTGAFTFFIGDWKKGKFAVSTDVTKTFDATIFNELLQPMALIRLDGGRVNSLRFQMEADTSGGHINLMLPYEDMKLSFLKKKGGVYKNKALFSFFTNIAIRNNNKTGPGTRTANITVTHKKHAAFFAFIWSSMLKGIKDISITKP